MLTQFRSLAHASSVNAPFGRVKGLVVGFVGPYPGVMEKYVVCALVGDHVELYQNSPNFKAAIDRFAEMLPAMVDGLADKSRIQDEAHEAAVRRAASEIGSAQFWTCPQHPGEK